MGRFDQGWVKLYRRCSDEDLAKRGTFTIALWTRILMWANWKESKAIVDGEQIEIKPGQLLTGLKELTWEKEDPHLNKVRGSLKYLNDSQRIKLQSYKKGTLITVINWETYQENNIDAQVNNNQIHNSTTTQPQLSKERRKKKKKEELLRKKEIESPTEEINKEPTGDTLPSAGVSKIPIEAKIRKPRKPRFSESTRAKMNAFIAAYANKYKAKYNAPPQSLSNPAIIGQIGNWIENVSQEKAIHLVEVYLQINYRPFDESYHDLRQFFWHLNRIGVALEKGDDSKIDWNAVFGTSPNQKALA